MRKFFTLLSLCMMLVPALQAQNYDWADELVRLNPEVVDSVIPIGLENPMKFTESCMIYYHQPLQHDNPSLGTINLRAVFIVYTIRPYRNEMVQMSIDGYELTEDDLTRPSELPSICYNAAAGEMCFRYEGHLLRPEHRFFGASCPEDPMEIIEHCNAKEAAADFHALAEAVKKVFKGKWAITGVSKGGMCAAIQHAYYPDDADCFVPYVAPIMKSASDMRIQERSMTEPWTPEMREDMRLLISKILNSPAVYNFYIKKRGLGPGRETQERCTFLADTYDKLAQAQQLMPRSTVADIFEYNKSYLKEKGLEDYSDAMLAFFLIYNLNYLKYFESWEKQEWNKENQSETPLSDNYANSSDGDINLLDSDDEPLDEDKVTARDFAAAKYGYYYQSLRELGYYGIKWDYFYDTQAKIDSVNALWQSCTFNPIDLNYRYRFGLIEYNPELMNLVRQQTASTTKPLLYIYGGDDIWTGAHIEDQYVNGKNVRYYILPEQNHEACIAKMTDMEKQDEIWAFLDAVFKNKPDAIEQIEQQPQGAKTRYNLMGQPADKAQGLSVEDGRVIFRK